MRRKLLLFISITLLFTFNSQAESDTDLPALPVDSVIELTNKNNDSDRSFWQKTKVFFGFWHEEDIEEPSDILPIPLENLEDEPLPALPNDKPVIPVENLKPRSKNIDSGLSDEIGGESLSIPKGFDDEEPLKLPSGFSENDTEPKVESLKAAEDATPKMLENIPYVVIEQKQELSGDLKGAIDVSTDSPKIPDAFPNKDIDNNEASEATSSEKPESIIGNEEKAVEELKTEIPASPDAIEDNTKKDNQITLPDISPSEDLAAKTESESAAKDVLPTPSYASTPETSKEPETSISRFVKNFEKHEGGDVELPKITDEDFIAHDDGVIVKKESVELDPQQLQFMDNEVQVLMLPNDDVVLGSITTESRIDDMDLHAYIKMFWKSYNTLKREPKREEIEQFIENYDENFNEEEFI